MKKYKGLLVLKTGSQANSNKLKQGKTLDLILIYEKHSWRNSLRIGKKISKTGKTSQYFNKFWRLGVLDSDLVMGGYILEDCGSLSTINSLDDDLKILRNKNIKNILQLILQKYGTGKMVFILILFILNHVLNKFRKFL